MLRRLRWAGLFVGCISISAIASCRGRSLEEHRPRAEPPRETSPTIHRLSTQVAAHEPDAETSFWRAVEASGTPLLEDDGRGDPLVTFLFRGGAQVSGVALLGSVGNGAPLDHLAGTEVWHRTVRVPRGARLSYRLRVEGSEPQVDPWNRAPFPPQPAAPLLSTVDLRAGAASSQPLAASPAGTFTKVSIRRGLFAAPIDAEIYTPQGVGCEPSHLLVFLEGPDYREIERVPALLDRLTVSGALPPTAALLLPSRNRDRDFACDRGYSDWLADRAVPAARQQLALAAEPSTTAIIGSSFGGLGAACAAFHRPDVFGSVLAQSGSFSWSADGPPFETLRRSVAKEKHLPIRWVLSVGTLERWPAQDGAPSLLDSNRGLRTTLQEKSYDVRYSEYLGGHGPFNWSTQLETDLPQLFDRTTAPRASRPCGSP